MPRYPSNVEKVARKKYKTGIPSKLGRGLLASMAATTEITASDATFS
jgi:hypothetical protein